MNNHSGNETTANPAKPQRIRGLSPAFFLAGILLGTGALATWFYAPPSMVTSVLLKEKAAVTSSLTGLQLGERLAEGGVSDLYLVLEFDSDNTSEQHRTEENQISRKQYLSIL